MGLFEEKQSNKVTSNYKLRMVVNWKFLNIPGGVGGYFGETKVNPRKFLFLQPQRLV